jgi:hypothetical protein
MRMSVSVCVDLMTRKTPMHDARHRVGKGETKPARSTFITRKGAPDIRESRLWCYIVTDVEGKRGGGERITLEVVGPLALCAVEATKHT